MTSDQGWFHGSQPLPWEQRLASIVDMMREMSRQTEPQRMVQTYARRIREFLPSDATVSLSRRELVKPFYRITRSKLLDSSINPWRDRDKLPQFDCGLLGDLLYAEQPVVIDDLQLARQDPGCPYIQGMRSLMALPLFDDGIAQNMVVILKREQNFFNRDRLPEMVWLSNLFGRATQNLVLSDQVREAYAEVERELQSVAEIQRSLLPSELPAIPGLQLAAHYQTSRQAGGDYYDFFPLADGRWGIFMADVAGHGTPAAVLMAVTHSIAHSMPGEPEPPDALLEFVNRQLSQRYTKDKGIFVTAFYGVYDPRERTLVYSRAGHCPPRLRRGNQLSELDHLAGLPLGIEEDETYPTHIEQLQRGDLLVFYTDGITEARSPEGDLFGLERLDAVLQSCDCHVDDFLQKTLKAVDDFTAHRPAGDDRTLLIAKVE